MSESSEQSEAISPRSDIGHSSIIFFHGIGNPRKLGTLANFLDEFDKYGSGQDYQTLGVARDFRHRIEDDGNEVMPVIQFLRIKKFRQQHVKSKIIRAYESYWGNDLTKPVSLIVFTLWLCRILINSVRLLCAPLRRFPLYRIRSIHLVSESFSPRLNREKLESLYQKFSSLEATKLYPKGSATEFQDFLGRREVLRQYGDFRSIALQWHLAERRSLKRTIAQQLLLLISALLMTACLYLLVYVIIKTNFSSLREVYPATQLLSLVILATSYWLAWMPVRQRISDVLFWATLDERENGYAVRERRVAQAEQFILRVISNPRCNDCTIVAHSLGSAIAMEALFRIATRVDAIDINEAQKQRRLMIARKVKFAFLLGSPIDNIFSLFQEDWGRSRRYSRIQEQKAPNLKSRVFQDANGEAGLTIVNFWSRFDPISAKIISLRTPDNHKRKMIFNSECLPEGIPFPLSTHSGYFQDTRVVGTIYSSIMTGRLDGGTLRPSSLIDPEQHAMIQFALLALVAFLPSLPALFLFELGWLASLVIVPGLVFGFWWAKSYFRKLSLLN